MSTPTARQVSTDRVKELIAREEDKFKQARPRSQKLWQEAREVMPRGVPSSFQDAAPQPVFMERGKGSRVWDVDGNEYVDFHNGFGVMVVGHAHPKIVDAVSQRIALGSHFAQPTPDDLQVARELARRFGLPQWRFTNSGTESTLDAVRIARGFTGRQRLIKMEASYHGHHDALMVSVEPPPELMGPADAPASVPQSEGIPPGYLAGLRDVAQRHGALLIFDEVKTGITIAAGGATERFGVTPDLIALAKAIGGGLPCGAVGGTANVMSVIEEKRVAQMGTFNGNPLTMAASRVTLYDILDASAYAHFDALAETVQGGLDEVIADHELPFHVITLGARGGITYRAQRVRNYRDYLEIDKSFAYLSWLYQCNRGVLMAPGAEENWTLSVQHSADDMQRYVDNFAEMARDLRS
ncbi:MAG: aminotransferase class III-fold pyridoxal phosphate-dependent enzyme [Chloroflexi bacterium]|nr:MAG: aminotransferase class III-fold pyridoxal phosphate-dependent enzyme [Chloroflexota bacterium]